MVGDVKPILYLLFYASMVFEPVLTDCSEHTFLTNANTVITWPASPSSDLWIASDCLDSDKRLVFRQCVGDTWIPSNDEIIDTVNPLCYFVMNNEVRVCPFSYTAVHIEGPPSRTLCALLHDADTTADTVCTKETVSFAELNSEDKYQIIETMSSKKKGVFRLGARNMWLNKSLSRFQNKDIELQNTVCGRFGLLLKLSNNSMPVNCPEVGECDNMCLSLNILDKKSVNESVEKCGRGLFTIFEMTFLDQFGCPVGYYRAKFYPTRSSCFSIKMFDEPVQVTEITSLNDFESYCAGTVMNFNRIDDMFIFRQISEHIGLSNGNNCLFGQHDSNYLVNYTSWRNYSTRINETILLWDKTMNYGRLEEEISYLASKPNGEWTWALDTISCIACVVDVAETPELRLQYTFLQRKLELDVTHQDFLYKQKISDFGFICFALIGNIYKDNVTIFPINNSIGKYSIENVGMGKYWCSGHNIATGDFYSSNKIDAYGIDFVFKVVRKCDTNCVFRTDDLNDFVEILSLTTQVVTAVEALYIQLIKNESKTQYTFIAHLSLTLQDNELIENLDLALMNLTSYQKETVLIYENLKKMIHYNESNQMSIESIRSTEFCLHESVSSIDTIVWRVAYIDEVIFLSSLCPTENYSEITRICLGDHVHGAFWENSINVSNCYTVVSKYLLEVYLTFTDSSQTEGVIQNVKNIIQENIDVLLPVDVFLTSKIHQKITNVTFSVLESTLLIFNTILQIEENILKVSASMNSTNILLEALNTIFLSYIESINGRDTYLNEGNISILLPLIEIFILDPLVSNLSGIALFKPLNASMSDEYFTNYLHRYVYQYESIDYLPDHDLIIGSYIPPEKINFRQNVSIALVVFFNDKLFQSNKGTSDDVYFKANGKIMSIMIVGSVENSIKVPIFFQPENNDNVTCAHWNVTSIDGWSSYGCSLRNVIVDSFHQLAICECSHSNHFGCYISKSHRFVNIADHTLIIIIASLLGIIAFSIAFLIWRKNLLTFFN